MRVLRILLINPKSSNVDHLPIPPLGILYLAAYIRENGFPDLSVIDNNRENRSMDVLETAISQADIVGLTGTTSQYNQAREIATLAEKYHIKRVMGGPHASFLWQEILEKGEMDAVVFGEGELSFLEILRAISTGKPLVGIAGVGVRTDNGTAVMGAPRSLVSNLDILPIPARDLVPVVDYPVRELKRFDGSYTHMMSSRGCSGKCYFCSSPFMWGTPRFRSAEKTFAEMLAIYQLYRISNIHFQDDAFTSARARLHKLCELITDSGINFKWSCQARPDHVDRELLLHMRLAGCVQVEFGVESADERITQAVQKGYTKVQVEQAFRWAYEVGLNAYGFFIVGLPGETLSSWVRSILFARSLKMVNSRWSVLVPFPGTRVFKEKLVEIVDTDFLNWRLKHPVIKSGHFGPKTLGLMRTIADKLCNGLRDVGTYKA